MLRSPTLASALLAATLLAVVVAAARAAPVRTEHVEAELIAERTAVVPGQPLTGATRLSMDRGWHTYWRNPGDSGLPTTLAWNLPQGLSAGPIEWPAPRALSVTVLPPATSRPALTVESSSTSPS